MPVDDIKWGRLDGRYVKQAGNDTLTGTLTFPNTGLHMLDTNASHDLIIAPGSNLTADKTLNITTGDSDRTITLSGNPTLADWFDQSVKQASSPTFAGATLTGFSGYVKAAAGVLSASAIADGDLPATIKGLTLSALTTGFSIAGGTTSKTLTVPLDASVSGTNTGDQDLSGYQTKLNNSAGLASALGDESGTGYAAFTDSPVFTTQIATPLIITASGDLALTPNSANTRLAASAYLNWGATGGTTGYGLRDNAGVLQYKDSGGSWNNLQPQVLWT